MIAAARFNRSSSDTPEGAFSLSIKAFFSASSAACLRMYSEAFAASASAIFLLQSTALGRMSSTFKLMTHSPGQLVPSQLKPCTEPLDFTHRLETIVPHPSYLVCKKSWPHCF